MAAAPLPVLPRLAKGAKRKKALPADVAAYRGRTHAVGTISFGVACELETVSKLVSTFVRAFCPRDGLRVRVSRGPRTEVLPIRFTQTASISATQLARGGSVELTENDFETAARPLFWVTSLADGVAEGEADAEPVRLSFTWCIARPSAERAELAISEAMSTMLEAAADAKDCIAALVTAQGRPLTMAAPELPYESLASTTGRAEDAAWLRRHVRSPAWHLLVPRGRTTALAKPPPRTVSLQRARSGTLVRADAPTPFAMTDTSALETWLLPVL
jgi:hypothetical protein